MEAEVNYSNYMAQVGYGNNRNPLEWDVEKTTRRCVIQLHGRCKGVVVYYTVEDFGHFIQDMR